MSLYDVIFWTFNLDPNVVFSHWSIGGTTTLLSLLSLIEWFCLHSYTIIVFYATKIITFNVENLYMGLMVGLRFVVVA
jgi:hypothetical protein